MDFMDILSEARAPKINNAMKSKMSNISTPDRVISFKYDRVYVGSPIDFKDVITSPNKKLFITPFKGVASLFTTDRSKYKIKSKNVNIAYDEWKLPISKLSQPFSSVHVIIEGEPNRKPFTFKSSGYIYEIDIRKYKDMIYAYKWMDYEREFLLMGLDKIPFINKYKHDMVVEVRGGELITLSESITLLEAPTNIDGSLDDTDTEDYNSEVEADTADTGADTTAEDDTDAEDDATADEEPTSDDETTEDETTEEDDTTEEEAPEDEEATDYSAETDEVTVDDTGEGEDDTMTDDTSSEEETTEEPNEEDFGNLSNKSLIKDFINLYDSINTTIDKLDSLPISDMEALSISITTKHKLAKLTDFIYVYVTGQFHAKNYSENLYIYKYIVQLYKISVEILSKINKIH